MYYFQIDAEPMWYLEYVWIALASAVAISLRFCVDPVYYSQDPRLFFSATFSLKLGPMTLFTHLKIILLQCFQFSTISGIQTNP